MPDSESLSDAVAARIQDIRRRRGWSAAQLADQCAKIGAPEMTSWVIGDIERGRREKGTGRRRRHVTVDELVILAAALDVAPVNLLLPIDPGAMVKALPHWTMPASLVRAWVRGACPLPFTDPRIYRSEVPRDEWEDTGTVPPEAAKALREMMTRDNDGGADRG